MRVFVFPQEFYCDGDCSGVVMDIMAAARVKTAQSKLPSWFVITFVVFILRKVGYVMCLNEADCTLTFMYPYQQLGWVHLIQAEEAAGKKHILRTHKQMETGEWKLSRCVGEGKYIC